ncbi:hypothetical protein CYMTET_51549 [Cymbomonas tetramitiformis]|uniref:Uncharacterized protein n=1 Tax=Cymbomonas tetramitiformis TaxID=36881 RepID=A0AAE0BKY6_9CHLO|nr:hypothetical protein CYMTET_51549 [Cymbomonas tetramitiformis]
MGSQLTAPPPNAKAQSIIADLLLLLWTKYGNPILNHTTVCRHEAVDQGVITQRVSVGGIVSAAKVVKCSCAGPVRSRRGLGLRGGATNTI